MALDDVAPEDVQQRRVAAWAAVRDAEPMAVQDPAALMAELEAIGRARYPAPSRCVT